MVPQRHGGAEVCRRGFHQLTRKCWWEARSRFRAANAQNSRSDEFYVSDLAGCTVTDSGREIGRIKDVQFGSGEAPLLVVQGEKE